LQSRTQWESPNWPRALPLGSGVGLDRHADDVDAGIEGLDRFVDGLVGADVVEDFLAGAVRFVAHGDHRHATVGVLLQKVPHAGAESILAVLGEALPLDRAGRRAGDPLGPEFRTEFDARTVRLVRRLRRPTAPDAHHPQTEPVGQAEVDRHSAVPVANGERHLLGLAVAGRSGRQDGQPGKLADRFPGLLRDLDVQFAIPADGQPLARHFDLRGIDETAFLARRLLKGDFARRHLLRAPVIAHGISSELLVLSQRLDGLDGHVEGKLVTGQEQIADRVGGQQYPLDPSLDRLRAQRRGR